MADNWEPEPRPIPQELGNDYRAEPYTDPWNSVMERIATANPELLKQLMNYGIGEPHE